MNLTELSTLQLGSGWFPEQSGGLNRFYYDLLHHLHGAGVRCCGLVAGTENEWPAHDLDLSAFAPLRAALLNRWIAERRAVVGKLAERPVDVAVTHFAPYAFPVLHLVTRGRPLVVHFQGPWAQESRQEGAGRLACAAKAAIERRVYCRATRLIVLSNAFKQILIDDYGICADRICVIPGGVDCDRYDVAESRVEARTKLGWPINRPIVLAVRRLARRMGLENLVEAAVEIRREVPEVLILIAGGGAQRDGLNEAIKHRQLDNTVRLLGYVPDSDLPLAYRAADLTVVPTIALEGFGLVAAESLAAGTPALATPVGGLVDLLGPLSDELLFKSTRTVDIARGLEAALTGGSNLPDSATCRRYAREQFGWDVIARRVAAVYREAAAVHQRRHA